MKPWNRVIRIVNPKIGVGKGVGKPLLQVAAQQGGAGRSAARCR